MSCLFILHKERSRNYSCFDCVHPNNLYINSLGNQSPRISSVPYWVTENKINDQDFIAMTIVITYSYDSLYVWAVPKMHGLYSDA